MHTTINLKSCAIKEIGGRIKNPDGLRFILEPVQSSSSWRYYGYEAVHLTSHLRNFGEFFTLTESRDLLAGLNGYLTACNINSFSTLFIFFCILLSVFRTNTTVSTVCSSDDLFFIHHWDCQKIFCIPEREQFDFPLHISYHRHLFDDSSAQNKKNKRNK